MALPVTREQAIRFHNSFHPNRTAAALEIVEVQSEKSVRSGQRPLRKLQKCNRGFPDGTDVGRSRCVRYVYPMVQRPLLAVQGEPPEDGLAAYGEDLMMAVARKIVSGDEEDVEMVEDVFAQAREPKGLIIALLLQGWCGGPRVSQNPDSLRRIGR